MIDVSTRVCVCVLNLFFECGNEAKEEKLKRKSTVLVKSSSLVVEKQTTMLTLKYYILSETFSFYVYADVPAVVI